MNVRTLGSIAVIVSFDRLCDEPAEPAGWDDDSAAITAGEPSSGA